MLFVQCQPFFPNIVNVFSMCSLSVYFLFAEFFFFFLHLTVFYITFDLYLFISLSLSWFTVHAVLKPLASPLSVSCSLKVTLGGMEVWMGLVYVSLSVCLMGDMNQTSGLNHVVSVARHVHLLG